MSEVTTIENNDVSLHPFKNVGSYEQGMQIAQVLSKSDMIPQHFRGKPENCLVALELANRVGMPPLMCMQNLNVIQGKPSWSSQFIIAVINNCGQFSKLRFKFEGEPGTPDRGCIAYAREIETDEVLEGPKVTWEMVTKEGWLAKAGSKWKTMPEVMFQYRAAAFFGRMYCPEILQGMHAMDEVIDSVKEQQEVKIDDL